MTNRMTERHILKFELLGVVEQQRIMKKLEQSARQRSKTNTVNVEEIKEEVSAYYHRRKVVLSRQARALNLYRAFLKGKRYHQVEQALKSATLPAWRLLEYFNIPCEETWAAFDLWLEE